MIVRNADHVLECLRTFLGIIFGRQTNDDRGDLSIGVDKYRFHHLQHTTAAERKLERGDERLRTLFVHALEIVELLHQRIDVLLSFFGQLITALFRKQILLPPGNHQKLVTAKQRLRFQKFL